ncbi:unnamed protein product [Larinioides sclopetarius]|uniref:Uncharacterized protein n=1 Tax=Larinioides sclopetarius TaxID=280406 RepID=A0AAV2BHL2_9ARAC
MKSVSATRQVVCRQLWLAFGEGINKGDCATKFRWKIPEEYGRAERWMVVSAQENKCKWHFNYYLLSVPPLSGPRVLPSCEGSIICLDCGCLK